MTGSLPDYIDTTAKNAPAYILKEVNTDEVESEESSVAERPPCFRNSFEECLFVLTATLATAQTSVFQGAIFVTTAAIGRDLNMNAAEITWISAGSSLTGGAFLLCFGRLADMIGRKKVFVFAMSGYTASLFIMGFANNGIFMDAFSGVIGLFSAAMVPPAIGSLGAVYEKPSKRKNYAFACFSAGNALGFVVGMVVTGIAAQEYSWRASFWALSVIYAIFTLLSIWTVPSDPLRTITSSADIKHFDLPGTFLVVTGFGCVSTSLSLAGDAPQGWQTSYVIAILVIGIALLACFLFWQCIAPYPLMPLYIWRDRKFCILIAIFSLCYMAFMPTFFFLPLYLQEIKHISALKITAQLLPMSVSGLLANVICAFIMHRVHNNILMGISVLAYLGCFLTLSVMNESASYWSFIFPALILLVLGMDMQYNVTNLYVMAAFPPDQQSMAGGIFNTVTKLWSNIGMGIATFLHSYYKHNLADGQTSIRPYLVVYWYAAALAGVALFFVPFLTLGKQGVMEEADERKDGGQD